MQKVTSANIDIHFAPAQDELEAAGWTCTIESVPVMMMMPRSSRGEKIQTNGLPVKPDRWQIQEQAMQAYAPAATPVKLEPEKPKRRPRGKPATSTAKAPAVLLADAPPAHDEEIGWFEDAVGWYQDQNGAWLRTDDDLAVA